MDYKDLLDSAKEFLKSDNTAFEEYYKKAAENLEKSYAASMASLESQYQSSKNQAAAQSQLTRKNNDQLMASRGLARSGESVQEHLNADLSLDSTLSNLSENRLNQLTQLQNSKNNALLALENSKAEKAYEYEQQLIDSAFKLADAEVEIEQRENESKENPDTGENNNESNSTDNVSDTNTSDSKFTQNEMRYFSNTAKNIIATATYGEDMASTASHMIKISDLLHNLEVAGTPEKYIDEIKKQLITMGYRDPSEKDKAEVSFFNKLSEIYDEIYEKEYMALLEGGYAAFNAKNYAKQKAYEAELDYIMSHCGDLETYYAVADKATIPRDISYNYAKSHGYPSAPPTDTKPPVVTGGVDSK